MNTVNLDPVDAVELGELLTFLRDWLNADPEPLKASLTTYLGSPGYNLNALRADLARFSFLLGSDDGHALLGEQPE